MGQYRPMFNVSLQHEYFSDGRLAGVEMRPTQDSVKLMTNTNLVTRKRPDGIMVFFDQDYLDSLRLYAADEDDPLRLDFDCDVDHGNFQNFTDAIDFSDTKSLHFDSNNTDLAQLGTKFLHAQDFVSTEDLIDRPPAKVGSLTPSLGTVSIRVSPDELDNLLEGDAYNNYQIRFRARETYWKYYLIGDANREGAFIRDVSSRAFADGDEGENEIKFNDMGEELLADGRTARVFISSQPIALRDRHKAKFQLLVPRNNRVKVVVKRLAVASAKRINRVRLEDRDQFVSEIYVNF